MKNIILKLVLITVFMGLTSFDKPSGWIIAGSAPGSYEMGIDKGAGQNGGNAGTIKAIKKRTKGFGTLLQEASPDAYKGKRLRMTGYMKSKDVKSWAGLWLRVDECNVYPAPAFDNMYDRPIKGTSDWTKCEIVLDVADDASKIVYGALLDGAGQIWFDNITFEIVGNDVPVTGPLNNENKHPKLEGPSNLDFEK